MVGGMSYERGKAPPDAPVTWERSAAHSRLAMLRWPTKTESFHETSDADAICRAFHLAALAEEARGYLARPRHEGEDDWCRRYDAAKVDA